VDRYLRQEINEKVLGKEGTLLAIMLGWTKSK
jgi:hypothetical protein